MTSVVFYFQVHQPYRLHKFSYSDVGTSLGVDAYFDDKENERIVKRVAERCYVPMNEILLRAIEEDERFCCSFSLSGTVLSQLEEWAPEALDTFVRLAETGRVEYLCETSHHSLAFLGDELEWEAQIRSHRERIETLFGKRPTTFRNTELVIDNRIAERLDALGFDVLLGEGADRLLEGKSPRHAYLSKGSANLKLLLRDYSFSDDIAFRFSNREWPEYPLMADKFAGWLHELPQASEFVGLFMDYETFGEHQWAETTGILEFMKHVPGHILEDPRFDFATPAEIAQRIEPVGDLDIDDHVSWADAERDLSAWLANPMQKAAHEALYAILPDVRAAAGEGREDLLAAWRKLSTSDHVYYMCTKFQSTDGDVHEYFSPFPSPHDAFITFMNVVDDLTQRVHEALVVRS